MRLASFTGPGFRGGARRRLALLSAALLLIGVLNVALRHAAQPSHTHNTTPLSSGERSPSHSEARGRLRSGVGLRSLPRRERENKREEDEETASLAAPSSPPGECVFPLISRGRRKSTRITASSSSTAVADAQSYCARTNPSVARASFVSCAGDNRPAVRPWFQYVITFTEEALTSRLEAAGGSFDQLYARHLRWIDELPGGGGRVLFVKSNATRSFRGNGMRWGGMQNRDAKGAVGNFVSLARRVAFQTCVTVVEAPNVGDEALSVASFASSFYDRIAVVAADARVAGRGEVPYTVFLHGHRESWHAIDAVVQMRCLCMSEGERFRTLTTPERAFFLQCMPLSSSREAEEEVEGHRRTPLRLHPVQQQQLEGLQQPQRARLIRFWERQASQLANVSRRFGVAFMSIFPGEPVPPAIVRDCCASFVVSADAILARPRSFYRRLAAQLAGQPNATLFPLLDGDMSMYLERFWRYLFSSSVSDLHRDLTALKCTQERFECISSFGAPGAAPTLVNISFADGSADLPLPWRARQCPSGISNRFRH